MKLNRHYAALVAAVGQLCLCSCTTRNPASQAVLQEVSFDDCDDYIHVKLHLANGKEFICMVDTGSPVTILPGDLEPELGECVGTNILEGVLGPKTNRVYLAPKLYIGDTLLQTGKVINTSGGGNLGMSTLRHYCIQLDFTSNKMRFLDPNHLDTKNLGKAFPLTTDDDGHIIVHAHFLGLNRWLIDTGDPFDAALKAPQFDRVLRDQHYVPVAVGAKDRMPYSGACLSKAIFGDFTCTDLYISDFLVGEFPNAIGLPFLARYLVTFNFPKRKVYLKQVKSESPVLGALLTMEAKTCLRSLADKDQLPGWSKDNGDIHWATNSEDSETYPVFRILKFQTGGQGNATAENTCQYSVVQESQGSPWKLQRAWRSDANGRIVEEYPLP